MTTIIARKVDDRVELAFDSMASDDNRSWSLTQRKVAARGGIVVGVAGSVRALNIAAKITRYGDTVDQAVEAFRRALGDGGCLRSGDGGDSWDGGALFIIDGRIYEVDADFSWVEDTRGVAAVGSGAQFALGAIAAGATTKRAIEVAAELDPYTGGALFITDAERIKSPWAVSPIKDAA